MFKGDVNTTTVHKPYFCALSMLNNFAVINLHESVSCNAMVFLFHENQSHANINRFT